MKKKPLEENVRINTQVDAKTGRRSVVLRTKHHINLSSLIREAINNKYEELEK
jgi:regulator of extracellular matrix RemA (YlzA/DUF370 family)